MGCNCKDTIVSKEYAVQQMYRNVGDCFSNVKRKVFPISLVQAIEDACTGKRLDELLLMINHISVPFNTDESTTYANVDTRYRRVGLVVTTKLPDGSVLTKQYNGADGEEANWVNPINWVELASKEPINTEIGDLRDILNRLVELESKPDLDTIYDDTEVKRKLTEIATKVAQTEGLQNYDDTELRKKITDVEAINTTQASKISALEAKAFPKIYVVSQSDFDNLKAGNQLVQGGIYFVN